MARLPTELGKGRGALFKESSRRVSPVLFWTLYANDVFKIERATIVTQSYHMPPRKRGRRKSSRRGGGGGGTVRLTKGKVLIKVGGFPGTQKLAPAVLIRKIAKKHIRKAASSVLRGTKGGRVARGRRRKGTSKKGRKGRKKRRRRGVRRSTRAKRF